MFAAGREDEAIADITSFTLARGGPPDAQLAWFFEGVGKRLLASGDASTAREAFRRALQYQASHAGDASSGAEGAARRTDLELMDARIAQRLAAKRRG
jgi:hypothetical protein